MFAIDHSRVFFETYVGYWTEPPVSAEISCKSQRPRLLDAWICVGSRGLMNNGTHVLVVGRDRMLLQSRQLILGTYFQTEAAGRIQEAAAMIASRDFDLIVLCFTLSDDECRQVAGMVQHQDPR